MIPDDPGVDPFDPFTYPELEPSIEPVTIPLREPPLFATQTITPPSTTTQLSTKIQPLTQPATEPLIQPLTGPLTQPATEPLIQPLIGPLPKPLTEPLTEPLTKPATYPQTQLLTEPLTKPATYPQTQLLTEPLTKPATYPQTQPLTEPLTPGVPIIPDVPEFPPPPPPPPPPPVTPGLRRPDEPDDPERVAKGVKVRIVGIQRGAVGDTRVDLVTGAVETVQDIVAVPPRPTKQSFTVLAFNGETPSPQRIRWGAKDNIIFPDGHQEFINAGAPLEEAIDKRRRREAHQPKPHTPQARPKREAQEPMEFEEFEVEEPGLGGSPLFMEKEDAPVTIFTAPLNRRRPFKARSGLLR